MKTIQLPYKRFKCKNILLMELGRIDCQNLYLMQEEKYMKWNHTKWKFDDNVCGEIEETAEDFVYCSGLADENNTEDNIYIPRLTIKYI